MGYHHCEVHDRDATNGCWECERDEHQATTPARRAAWLAAQTIDESWLRYEGMTGRPYEPGPLKTPEARKMDEVVIRWIQTGVWEE